MLHSLGSTVQINDTLVDFHLEPVLSLGALTTGVFLVVIFRTLGLHFEVRVLGPTNEVATH